MEKYVRSFDTSKRLSVSGKEANRTCGRSFLILSKQTAMYERLLLLK
jgi:hypothetical protein